MTRYLTLDDLVRGISRLGIGPIRDLGLLESAAHRPRTNVFGVEVYPSLETKAAVLMESLVRNHPLVDGNKRLGWAATQVFLRINGIQVLAPEDEAYDLVIGVAEGRIPYEVSAQTLAIWFPSADQ